MNTITSDFLEAKRLITDPLADNVVAEIISSGYEKNINEVFMKLVRNNSYSPEVFKGLPDKVYALITNYFEVSGKLPDWADPELIEEGEKVFSQYGPEIFMLLNVKSLPLCYSCAKGSKVLYDTGRLTEHNGKIDPLARRLMETAQMVMDVLHTGGLAPGGSGIITMQKVRLIHASIRYFLKNEKINKSGEPWDVATYGEPINQEDLTGTLMSFAPVILSGLKQLNIELSESQIQAYSHCWKVVGYMMGINDDLLPDTYQEGWELATAILKDQAAESMEGRALTTSCVNFMKYIIPGNLLESVPEYLIWYFMKDVNEAVGKNLTDFIGIENHENKKDEFIVIITRFFAGEFSHFDHSKVVQKLTEKFNKVLLHAFLKHYNDGKRVHFLIPPSLQKDWNLVEEWQDQFAVTPSIFGNRLMFQKKNKVTLKK